MKLSVLLIIVVSFAWGSTAGAATSPLPPLPTLPQPPPMPAPELTGIQSAVLLDINSGQILMAEHDGKAVNPSGLVKLMTAYLMYQAEKQGLVQPGENVQVSDDAWHAQGSRMFIQPGMPVTMTQLEHGLLIDGGNDAAIAIAQTVAGSVGGFVELMNHDAVAMGLHHTHFTNPDGGCHSPDRPAQRWILRACQSVSFRPIPRCCRWLVRRLMHITTSPSTTITPLPDRLA